MGRADCCLCDEAAEVVADAAQRRLCTWEKVDIGTDETLSRRYSLDIPVVLIDGEVCFRHRLDPSQFGQVLAVRSRERGVQA
ncbi:MAG TPA: glutaredoxin family protein [Mariprofundaceae bacterium]|nr:glutaredoxin family protein [Mariprofundaceae bacterium]